MTPHPKQSTLWILPRENDFGLEFYNTLPGVDVVTPGT